jgi:hypothetical protein
MNVRKVQTNFTGGEIGELLEGRSNMQVYEDGMAEIRNFRIMPQGGIRRRPGFKYCATLTDRPHQLEDYVFNSTQKYLLCFYNTGVTIHDGTTGALLTTLTGSPWTTAQIGELSVHTMGDYIIVAHEDVQTWQIKRTGASTFTQEAFAYEKQIFGSSAPIYQPYYKYVRPEVTMRVTFLAYSGGGAWVPGIGWEPGSTATIICSESFFTASYVGLYLKIGTGQFEITSYTSATQVSAVLRSNDFRLPLGAQPLRSRDGTNVIRVFLPGHGLGVGSKIYIMGAEPFRNLLSTDINGDRAITGVASPDMVDFQGVTLADRSAYGGGLSVYFWCDDITTADWSEPLYSSVRGWPACVTGHQNRLVLAGGKSSVNRINMSKTDAAWNFDVGTGLDDESIQTAISYDRVPIIRHMISDKHLQIFTTEGEFYAPFGIGNKPLTPSTISIINQSKYGTRIGLPPVSFDGSTLFITKTRKSLRELVFGNNDVGYSAPNISFQAAHLMVTPSRLDALMEDDEQQEAVAYIVNSDGTVATFSFVRKEQVAAWSLWNTNGTIRNICVVDRLVFAVVARTINGSTVVCLEQLDHDSMLDCSLTVAPGSPTTTFTGFTHLANQSVDVVVDGTGYLGTKTVNASGHITIDSAADQIEAGFGFTPSAKTLPPEVALPDGPTMGQPRRIVKVTFQLHDSVSVKLVNHIFVLTVAEEDLTTAPELKTRKVEMWKLGWDNKGQVEFTAPHPVPFTLLSLGVEIEF